MKIKLFRKIVIIGISLQGIYLLLIAAITPIYFDIWKNLDNSKYIDYADFIFDIHSFLLHDVIVNIIIALYFICIAISLTIIIITLYNKYKRKNNIVSISQAFILLAASLFTYLVIFYTNYYFINI